MKLSKKTENTNHEEHKVVTPSITKCLIINLLIFV
jgi:hypothetical protein